MTILSLDNLAVGWPGQNAVLSGLNFSLKTGARIGIVGPNGAGKTSLFHTIAGILPPKQGQVLLRGQPVRQGQFLPDVALVFQQADDQLFCPTLAEDVAFGARNLGLPQPEIDARVASALHACGLIGQEGRPVTQLSGGEKRRACIAGALVMQPALMLLDEPSAALDLRSRRRLIALLTGMEQAMLIASHDLELLLDLCARVIVLDAGRICADGPARTVLGNAALMHAHGQEVPHSLTPHTAADHQHRPQTKV
jgi:cobalt/nickel transport system ATP-binding protein